MVTSVLSSDQLSAIHQLLDRIAERQRSDFGNIVSDVKPDGTLITACDRWSDAELVKGLASIAPGEGVLSEEGSQRVPKTRAYWVVDPLDGTKDFLQGTGEYAVHLALVRGQRPVLGVVLLPEADELWIGIVGEGAWCEDRQGERSPVRFSDRTAVSDLILVASRSHRDDRLVKLIDALALGGSKAVGSVGYKGSTILRGETDLYVSLSGRSAPKDWDMAAPEAVLLAAGGRFTHADQTDLAYNTGDVRQAGCLIASHGKAHVELGESATRAMAEIDPGFQV